MRILLFALPILLIFSFPFYVMIRTGEFTAVERIVDGQNNDRSPYLTLTAYSDPWSYVKLKSVQNNPPEVLAIGTSRVMQFRRKFFSASFYNASRGISELRHLNAFWSQIPAGRYPKVLILGLDPNLMNPHWVFSSAEELYRKPSWKEWLRIFVGHWSAVYEDQFEGRRDEPFENVYGLKRIGLAARTQERGFVNDGSFLYGDYVRLSAHDRGLRREEEYKRTLKEIQDGESVYAASHEISEEKIKILEDFLKEAAQGGTHVVAYIPPFAPVIYKELLKRKEAYGYLWKLYPRLQPLFRKYGHRLFDFQDPSLLAASEDDFVDDVHDTGILTLKIHLKMILSDPLLRSVSASNIAELQDKNLQVLVNPLPVH